MGTYLDLFVFGLLLQEEIVHDLFGCLVAHPLHDLLLEALPLRLGLFEIRFVLPRLGRIVGGVTEKKD